jgi:hypothetical protein
LSNGFDKIQDFVGWALVHSGSRLCREPLNPFIRKANDSNVREWLCCFAQTHPQTPGSWLCREPLNPFIRKANDSNVREWLCCFAPTHPQTVSASLP